MQKPERFREWDDFALALVYRDTDGLKSLDDFPAQLFQLLNIRKDDVVVVHIMSGNMDARLTFDEVINCARQGDHFLLAGFDAQGASHGPASGTGMMQRCCRRALASSGQE